MQLEDLIHKYNAPIPRYTSYPTALDFSDDVDKDNLIKLSLSKNDPASLYIHIPFCKSICFFCGCSSSICTNHKDIDKYLSLLDLEIALFKDNGLKKITLEQIHIGGGTPNLLLPEQILRLGEILTKNFVISKTCEFSVELDPRVLTLEQVQTFVKIGVNRVSIGVQDINESVQKAVNRVQPAQVNIACVEYLRSNGINAMNVDLIYGLPKQSEANFKNTLEHTIKLSPSRIALFNYAHVPWIKSTQKVLEKLSLPTAQEKVKMFLQAKSIFEENGYVYVGLDHFAKEDDPLILARKTNTLHRNFQGYSTKAGLAGLAIGQTSIAYTLTSYRQNFKDFKEYEQSLLNGKFPIQRGIILNSEDILRRAIIMDIMCKLEVEFNVYGVDFKEKFKDVFVHLEAMQKDCLVELYDDKFKITNLGRLFLRNIAVLFDGKIKSTNQNYSKTH